MKLHQLKALVAVYESGSIQDAARTLHMSQPALSKSIKELESTFGVPLLVRSNRGITATEYGERLVRRARLMLSEARRAREEIEALKGDMDGKVSIGISPATPGTQFIAALNRYGKRYPKVQLQIHEQRPSKLMLSLREGQVDIALCSQPASRYNDGFQWTELYTQPSVLAVRKGHPCRNVHSLRELREQQWLLQDSLDKSRIGLMFEQYRIPPPERIIECSSGVMFCELALKTDAVSYWPIRVLKYVQMLGQNLEVLNLQEIPPALNVSLVYRNQELITREAQTLVDELVYAFKSSPGDP
ncbi:LysR family transcriptional regulator [Ectopseudomonas chengduensis]|nr:MULTISPECIES: LysR family transcriptional regulator [Pseudomonas]KJU81180.1 LysR family transcriptional regulator [Pseudomonas oleovorans]UZT80229.1 LysR family transcriptional regulator [Pseudomonas chengduensis]